MTAAISEQPYKPEPEHGRDLRAVPPPAPEPDAPAAAREVHAEQTARPADGAVQVRLGDDDTGIDVWVPPRGMWRNSGQSALHVGDFQRWADATLTAEDAEAWEDYDPTLDEINEFFERLAAATGDEPGKRGRSPRGSRNTRRR